MAASTRDDKDTGRVIYRDEIAHYIIPVLTPHTFQIAHSLSLDLFVHFLPSIYLSIPLSFLYIEDALFAI